MGHKTQTSWWGTPNSPPEPTEAGLTSDAAGEAFYSKK